jgi:hypothetical protein
VEFNQEETLDNFGTKFWQDFDAASDKVKVNMIDNSGMTIITGLVGVDGVHGGYSELHPVYAMAVETATPGTDKTEDDTWVFFIRNQGNEGSCAGNVHD